MQINKSLKRRRRKEKYIRVLDRVPRCVWRVGVGVWGRGTEKNNKAKTKGKIQVLGSGRLGSGGLQGLVTQASKFVNSTVLSIPQMACRKQVS